MTRPLPLLPPTGWLLLGLAIPPAGWLLLGLAISPALDGTLEEGVPSLVAIEDVALAVLDPPTELDAEDIICKEVSLSARVLNSLDEAMLEALEITSVEA